MGKELTKKERISKLIENTERLYLSVWNELERKKKVKEREDKIKNIFKGGE